MPGLSPQAAAQKWQRNFLASAEQAKASVQAMTESPMAKAAAAGDRYIAGVQRAYNDGTWAQNLLNTPIQVWKTAYVEKGIPNMANGAKAGQQKWMAHETEFKPKRDGIIAALPPRGTDAENDNRMVAFVRAMRAAKRG